MTREEAQKILGTWLASINKSAIGQREYIDGWFDEDVAEAFRMAIEALKEPTESTNTPTNTSTDLISRQNAIDAWNKLSNRGRTEFDQVLMTLPSADRPTVDKEYLIDLIQEAVYDGEACAKLMDMVDRPTGEWIDIDNYYRLATCSHCHKVTMFEKWGEYTRPYNFCPNCGAKMNKGGDDK